MKKTLPLALALLSLLTACSSESRQLKPITITDYADYLSVDWTPSKSSALYFSDLYTYIDGVKVVAQDIKDRAGATVTLRGYFTEQSPVDGSFMYLAVQPAQSCPFCLLIGDPTLLEVVGVYGKVPLSYTESLVEVTGKLEVATAEDSFGYVTQFRVLDASYKSVSGEKTEMQHFYSYVEETEVAVFSTISNVYTYIVTYKGELSTADKTGMRSAIDLCVQTLDTVTSEDSNVQFLKQFLLDTCVEVTDLISNYDEDRLRTLGILMMNAKNTILF